MSRHPRRRHITLHASPPAARPDYQVRAAHEHTYPRAIRLVQSGMVDVRLWRLNLSPRGIAEAFDLVAAYDDGVLRAIIQVGVESLSGIGVIYQSPRRKSVGQTMAQQVSLQGERGNRRGIRHWARHRRRAALGDAPLPLRNQQHRITRYYTQLGSTLPNRLQSRVATMPYQIELQNPLVGAGLTGFETVACLRHQCMREHRMSAVDRRRQPPHWGNPHAARNHATPQPG